MKKYKVSPLTALALSVAGLLLVAPVQAQAPQMTMLDSLVKGGWEIRFRDGRPSKKVCIRSGRELIQIHHRGRQCNRYVVEGSASQVTVQYTCPGKGYGRTSVRRENGRLVQLEGQGIEASRPFEFVAEARQTGACR